MAKEVNAKIAKNWGKIKYGETRQVVEALAAKLGRLAPEATDLSQ